MKGSSSAVGFSCGSALFQSPCQRGADGPRSGRAVFPVDAPAQAKDGARNCLERCPNPKPTADRPHLRSRPQPAPPPSCLRGSPSPRFAFSVLGAGHGSSGWPRGPRVLGACLDGLADVCFPPKSLTRWHFYSCLFALRDRQHI